MTLQQKQKLLNLFDRIYTFENFIDTHNKPLINLLKHSHNTQNDVKMIHVIGNKYSGKTHILHAWLDYVRQYCINHYKLDSESVININHKANYSYTINNHVFCYFNCNQYNDLIYIYNTLLKILTIDSSYNNLSNKYLNYYICFDNIDGLFLHDSHVSNESNAFDEEYAKNKINKSDNEGNGASVHQPPINQQLINYLQDEIFNLYNKIKFDNFRGIIVTSATKSLNSNAINTSYTNKSDHIDNTLCIIDADNTNCLNHNPDILNRNDLRTRIYSSNVFHLKHFSDDDMLSAILLYLKQEGYIINNRVIQYLINHYDRNIGKIIILLEQAFIYSLETSSPLGIKLIKKIISEIDD